MKRHTQPVVRLVAFGAACLLGVMNCAGSSALAADPDQTEANITRLTANLLESSQFAHHVLDRDLAAKLFDGYLDALDSSRSLFLKSDVDELARHRATLAQATRMAGDTTLAHAAFRRYLERLEQRSGFVAETLKTATFDFSKQDSFSLDREHAERPADLAAARELWRAQLRAEYLQEKLADVAPAQIASKLTRRHEQQLKSMKALSNDAVLEVYLNALAHVYDPHSDYMGREQLDSFSISMKLSLFGIGAALGNEDGYCTIRELLAGGPAARSGALTPGDRIVAVAQSGKEPVDVVNMPLSRTVQLIRGPKGTVVTLSVVPGSLPEGSPAKRVRLVRDEIKLEDQEAKARIIDLKRDAGTVLRLGVIDLPGFYAAMDERQKAGARSATADVARLVAKLKKENVQGIVLDLRRNGGGSLQEAISMTGLFIKRGPVVQIRGASGVVDVEEDQDSSVLYDGPLVVLASRFSASASEILAGALQDYGRALIVGDSQTFGKGTVQTIVGLAPLMDKAGLPYSYDPGALKVTISKFYRPGGGSTQLRGIASDLILPSLSDVDDVSESALDAPLPWDSVAPAKHDALNRVKPHLEKLRAQSARRIAADREFTALADDIARLKKSIASKSVALNEGERRKELAEAKERKAARQKERKALQASQPVAYDVTLKNAEAPGLTRAAPPKQIAKAERATAPDSTTDDPAAQDLAYDLILNEGMQILADYTELLRAPANAVVTTQQVR